MEATSRVRGCQPAHGWLPAVVPAAARSFRVWDPELAATLADAGAVLSERGADVEIAPLDALRADAPCVIVPIDTAVAEGAIRPLRAVGRVTRSLWVRARARAVRRGVALQGYPLADLFTWDLEQLLKRPGERDGSSPPDTAGRFPLHAIAIGLKQPVHTVLDAATEAVCEALGAGVSFGLPRVTQGKLIVIAPEGVLRIAIGPARQQFELARTALDSLSELHPPDVVERLLPRPLARGSLGLAAWTLESTLPGLRMHPTVGEGLTASCVEFLAALHSLDSPPGNRRSPVEDAEVIAAAVADGAWLLGFARALDRRLADLPRGFGHGDFWSGNLLVEAGELSGVVDWDAGGPSRLPLLDLLHLRLGAHRSRTRELLGPGLVSYLLPWASGGGDSPARSYCRTLGLNPEPRLLEDLVAAYWLDRVAHELEMYADRVRRPFWMAQNVHHVIGALTARFGPLR